MIAGDFMESVEGMSVLSRIQTIDDYSRYYLLHSEPVCSACGTRQELVIESEQDKFVFCPGCRRSGTYPGCALSRLCNFPVSSEQ